MAIFWFFSNAREMVPKKNDVEGAVLALVDVGERGHRGQVLGDGLAGDGEAVTLDARTLDQAAKGGKGRRANKTQPGKKNRGKKQGEGRTMGGRGKKGRMKRGYFHLRSSHHDCRKFNL